MSSGDLPEINPESMPSHLIVEVAVTKRKFGEVKGKKIKISDLNQEELKQVSAKRRRRRRIEQVLETKWGNSGKGTPVLEQILEASFVIASHKRRIWDLDQFKFTWQAGIIMVFNEGDCPKFDSTDKAFMERMLVCPMRSKFINCANDNTETNTYIIDSQIDENFVNWRSSLLDYLKGYCKIDGLCKMDVPKSMCEWKEDIISGNNELADWIFENVEVTNQIEDVVSLNDLKDKYKNNYGLRGVSDRDFMAIAKALFTSKGFEIKEVHQFRLNGLKKKQRNVVLRLKLLDDIEA